MIRSDKEIDDLAYLLADVAKAASNKELYAQLVLCLELIDWLRGAKNSFSEGLKD